MTCAYRPNILTSVSILLFCISQTTVILGNSSRKRIIRTNATSPTTLLVTWIMPINSTETWLKITNSTFRHETMVHGKLEYTLHGLTPGTNYTVQLVFKGETKNNTVSRKQTVLMPNIAEGTRELPHSNTTDGTSKPPYTNSTNGTSKTPNSNNYYSTLGTSELPGSNSIEGTSKLPYSKGYTSTLGTSELPGSNSMDTNAANVTTMLHLTTIAASSKPYILLSYWVIITAASGLGLAIFFSAIAMLVNRNKHAKSDLEKDVNVEGGVVAKSYEEIVPVEQRFTSCSESRQNNVNSCLSWGSEFDGNEDRPNNVYSNSHVDKIPR